MSFKGDIEPKDVFDILDKEENSYLVDVRTLPEWSFVGLPDLRSLNKNVLRISWLLYPNMDINQRFLEQLDSEISDKNAKIFFLCKVGGRSLDAAILAAKSGFGNCYNVSGGFEGKADKNDRRSTINGWRAQGLPWFQS